MSQEKLSLMPPCNGAIKSVTVCNNVLYVATDYCVYVLTLTEDGAALKPIPFVDFMK